MTNALSFRIKNGTFYEEEASNGKKQMLYRATDAFGLSYLITMKIGSTFDITGVYCLEDTADMTKTDSFLSVFVIAMWAFM